MTKKELAASVAEKLNITKVDANTVINQFIQEVEDALAAGEEVKLAGFGKLYVKNYEARSFNVAGKTLEMPARSVIRFKAFPK